MIEKVLAKREEIRHLLALGIVLSVLGFFLLAMLFVLKTLPPIN